MLFMFVEKRAADGRRLLTGKWLPVQPGTVLVAHGPMYRWACPD